MVFIEHEDEANWVKLWADGYLPELERICRLRNHIKGQEGIDGEMPYDHRHRDVIFHDLLDTLWSNYAAEAWKNRSARFPRLDPNKFCPTYSIFMLTENTRSDLPDPPLGLRDQLKTVEPDRKNDYRQFLLVFPGMTYSDGRQETSRILNTLNFRNRSPESYQDFATFKAVCEAFLEPLGDPYWAPGSLVKRMLVCSGFTSLY